MNNEQFSRREFLLRSAKAGTAVAAASALAYALYDRVGPANSEKQMLVTIPDFSIPVQAARTMSIVTGADRKAAVNKAIDMLGGIERFIKPGDKVLIKPNVGFAKAPSLGATTHPDLITEVVRLCYKRGDASQVLVADNPISDAQSCFTLSGIGKAATDAGGKIVMPKDSYFKPFTLTNAKLIKNWPILFEPLKGVNKIIGIAPVKDHHRSGASMAMKNWYGLLGGRRNIFHQDINTIIAELAIMIRPTFVILDGTEVMMTNGPTGGSVSDLRRANTMIASCDQVAADAFGCSLLNLQPSDLLYLEMAQSLKAGVVDYQSLKPLMGAVN